MKPYMSGHCHAGRCEGTLQPDGWLVCRGVYGKNGRCTCKCHLETK